MVVFRYFSWPQRSISYTTRLEAWTISGQSVFFLAPTWSFCFKLVTCWPLMSKPMISWPMDVVLPFSFSWAKLKTLSRRAPRPSSVIPAGAARIPVRVVLPLSTLPVTDTLTVVVYSSWCCEIIPLTLISSSIIIFAEEVWWSPGGEGSLGFEAVLI